MFTSSVFRIRFVMFLINMLYCALDALTAETTYSPLVLGRMLGNRGFLNKLNSAFDVDPTSGAVSIDSLADCTTATPASGTFATQKTNNVITALTLTSKETTLQKSPSQVNASFATGKAMGRVGLKHADTLYQQIQAQVIASLKAATIGNSIVNTVAGWIDNLIPAAATVPDVINQVIVPLQKLVDIIQSNNTNGTKDDLLILMPTNATSRLKGACRRTDFAELIGKSPTGNSTFDDVEIFTIDGTNFGGASQEYAFVLHKEAFAAKFLEPYVWGGGWQAGNDIIWRWTTVCPYAYGTVDVTNLAGELVNAAT